jgi:hypothetical protein
MKLKASRKDMKRFNIVLGVSYCKIQHLLSFNLPIAYSSGVYGWACDYYLIDGVLISTGYNPLKSKGVKIDYDLIKSYENKARMIITNASNYNRSFNGVNLLLKEFLQAITGVK